MPDCDFRPLCLIAIFGRWDGLMKRYNDFFWILSSNTTFSDPYFLRSSLSWLIADWPLAIDKKGRGLRRRLELKEIVHSSYSNCVRDSRRQSQTTGIQVFLFHADAFLTFTFILIGM